MNGPSLCGSEECLGLAFCVARRSAQVPCPTAQMLKDAHLASILSPSSLLMLWALVGPPVSCWPLSPALDAGTMITETQSGQGARCGPHGDSGPGPYAGDRHWLCYLLPLGDKGEGRTLSSPCCYLASSWPAAPWPPPHWVQGPECQPRATHPAFGISCCLCQPQVMCPGEA